MKKITAILLVAVMALSMVACGKKEAKAPETVGEFLLADFKEDASGTAQEIGDRLITNEIIPFMGGAMPVEPGLLSGFDNTEIKGFKEGVMFGPMMGTIPFVGYIFVLEDETDVEAFKTTLKDNANLRWNVCTEAEEITVDSEGSTVFFLMSPKEFEEQ